MRIGSISGSLTQRIDGESYLVAGSGVTIASGSNGSITLDLSNTTVTPASYTNADITVDAQGRITAASNGIAGITLGYFDPDAPPATPNARDAEFNNASDLTSYTLWNPGNQVDYNATVSNSFMNLQTEKPPGGNPYKMAGLHRDCPTGQDWTVWAKMSIIAAGVDFSGDSISGFMFSDNTIVTNPTTAGFRVIGVGGASFGNAQASPLFIAQTWNAFNSFAGGFGTWSSFQGPQIGFYIRCRFISSTGTLTGEISTDGVAWRFGGSITYTPTRIGFCQNHRGSTTFPNPNLLRVDFIRFTDSVNYNDLMLGNVV